MKFDSLSTTIKSGSEEMYFNSEDADQENIGNKLLNNIKNITHMVYFDKQGNNLFVVSDTAAQNKVFSDFRNSGDRNSRRYIMQLRSVITADQITEMIEPLFKLYSADKVEIGGSWGNEWDSEGMMGKVHFKSLMEFSGVEDGLAIINGEMKSNNLKHSERKLKDAHGE